MKLLVNRILKIFILSSIVLSSFVATANNDNPGDKNKIEESAKIEYSIYPIINSNKVRVAYQKTGNEKVTIKIFDAKKNLLFSDVQKNVTSLKRNYNLENIGDGTYYIKIISGDFETDQKIHVGRSEKNLFSAYLSPELIKNKVRIAFQHAQDPVRVSVLNEKGSKLYDKTITDTQNFSSLFNLSSLDSGKYTINISSNGKVTSNTYEIK
ncbi:MAG: hypothetical protein CMO01_14965 [Thalassobius sp.]|nr:hypothetical protein [Thalassovita sp.]